MTSGDNAVSMEIAGGSLVLPDPTTVPTGEVGDTYILTAPLGGYISNSTRSPSSETLTGVGLNTTNFPVPGNPNTTYIDTTTNISYRWDPITNSYVTVGDGRLYQFATRSVFPATGVAFNKYLDMSTGVEYYWDTSRMAYLVTGGGAYQLVLLYLYLVLLYLQVIWS